MLLTNQSNPKNFYTKSTLQTIPGIRVDFFRALGLIPEISSHVEAATINVRQATPAPSDIIELQDFSSTVNQVDEAVNYLVETVMREVEEEDVQEAGEDTDLATKETGIGTYLALQ